MEVLNYKDFRVTDEMLASKSKRFANYIIDTTLFYVLFFLLGGLLGIIAYVIGIEGLAEFLDKLENINSLLDRLITSVIFMFFYFILESISQRTVGKLITQSKVVLEDGTKPTPETIIIRSLCRIIPFEPLSFLGSTARGWHDSISKTYVVDTKIFEEQKKAYKDYYLIGKQ